jgi:myo-inositol 2-dehydrogenase / D-chiro-inositol 1-dehydrogenase
MSLGVGVIGAGVMGAEHARILRDEVRGAHLAAVADADPARAKAAAAGAMVHARAADLIANPAVEAVMIVAPDALHAELVRACLAAGKPVLCEKPLAATAAESLALVEAEVALNKRLIQVGYMRRFDPGYLAMKAALKAGDIGAAKLLHNTHRNASAPEWFVGAMPITNSFVHEADISRWLLDSEMTEATLHTGPGGDPLLITMRAASGVLVSTEVFMNCAYGYHVEAEMVGQTGTLTLAQPDPLVINRQGTRSQSYPDNWVPRFAAAYVAQTNAWVASLKTGQPCGASAWDGYVATALAEQLAKGLGQSAPVTFTFPTKPALYEDAT